MRVRGVGVKCLGHSDSITGGCSPKGWRLVRRQVALDTCCFYFTHLHDSVLLSSSDSSVVGILFWNVLPDSAPLKTSDPPLSSPAEVQSTDAEMDPEVMGMAHLIPCRPLRGSHLPIMHLQPV